MMPRAFQRTLCSLGALLLLAAGNFSFSQVVVPLSAARVPRINKVVDARVTVRLKGNTHPLAQARFDQGVASDALPMKRMLLVLKPSAAQHAALRQMLDAQHTKGANGFHQWLTPEQFGNRFGVADEDIATVSQWLKNNGFSVDAVGRSKRVIEFSGTAGQVAQAFHTAIHSYDIAGERHYANANDPEIPAALSPVVAGVASLHDFKRKSSFRVLAKGQTKLVKGQAPQLSIPTSNGTVHALAPGDFWKIYNETPLLGAHVDGTNQTIAIVGRTNIDPTDFTAFRSLFLVPDGYPANPLNIILNGPDPGIVSSGEQGEATLDTEWSSATAPNATVDFVVSQSTNSTDGVTLSQIYIIDNNLAPVMSTSFGLCEAFLGNAGNQLNNALEEQAAAQGITSMISTGDNGVAGCDSPGATGDASNPTVAQYGAAVSGDASTAFNVAVGGTGLNENGNEAAYWNDNASNQDLTSALGYIPETTWNDSCGPGGAANCTAADANLYSGSGGSSSCSTQAEDNNGNPVASSNLPFTCKNGYPKPSWQMSVSGIPADGVRDMPDVSLAAAGHDGYFICLQSSCTPDQSGSIGVVLVSGTSASAPSFTGIMALVNQHANARQGQANYTMYQLAAAQQRAGTQCNSSKQPVPNGSGSSDACVFYDTTAGNISVPCAGGSAGCSATTSGSIGTLTGPSATAGYDTATGLGSVNVANLVGKWNTVQFQGTSTTITGLTPTTFTHGQDATISIKVTPQSGAGVPTGDVALLTNSTNPGDQGVGFGTLTSGTLSGPVGYLPGGTYSLAARYSGDGTYGSSTSAPVQLTVSPEASATTIRLTTLDANFNVVPINGPLPYGSAVFIRVDVQGQSQQGFASGMVTLNMDGQSVTGSPLSFNNGQPLTLESGGFFEFGTGGIPAGNHTFTASYAGDPSFNPSTSAPVALTISKADTPETVAATTATGGGATITAILPSSLYGDAPSGTVSFTADGKSLGAAVAVTRVSDPTTGALQGTAALTLDAASTPTGSPVYTAAYSGDTNYNAATATSSGGGANAFTETPGPGSVTVAAGATAKSTITLTPQNGFAGTVLLTCSVANPSGSTATGGTAPACSLNPTTVKLGGGTAATTVLSVSTAARSSSAVLHASGGDGGMWWVASGGSSLACVLLLGIPARRRKAVWGAFLSFALLAVVSAGLGCGGGSGSGSGGTPAGTYVVTVAGTSGTATASASVTVVVQ